ncbi:MAG: maleylpyruvate isomerase family mycothiol-dependent enzyme [Chloroflexota bacterium]
MLFNARAGPVVATMRISPVVLEGAAAGFAELVAAVPPGGWERPALGVWSVRDLVGHASLALSTIEAYLNKTGTGAFLDGPVAYFPPRPGSPVDSEVRRARDEAIAQRGREAGEALGEDPARAVAELASRVTALVAASPDDAPVATPAGPMTLAGYLPTRTFELAVHSLDLAGALDLDPPELLAPSMSASLELAGSLAARHPRAADLLLAHTTLKNSYRGSSRCSRTR